MTTTATTELQHHVAELERRLQRVEELIVPLPYRPAAPPRPRKAAPQTAASTAPPQSAPGREPARRLPLSDLVGGRLLAWIGAAATFLGIALFLALAIARGWIGVEARVVLAGAGSLVLMAAGVWLHDRRGRTEASVALVAAATAGLFATLVVASQVYGLLPGVWALGGSVAVGSLATRLAVRWAGRVIGALGLIGALAAPLLVDAPSDATTVAILGVTAACAMVVVARQRWHWLGLAASLTCLIQWGPWVLDGGRSTGATLAALGWFGAIGFAAALARPAAERPRASAVLLVALNGLVVGAIGALALHRAADGNGAELWLAGWALAHGVLGVRPWCRLAISPAMRRELLALGLILADVGFGLSATGLILAAGWGLLAVALAALTRRAPEGRTDRLLLELGVGAHIALTLVRALLDAPPTAIAGPTPGTLPLLAVASLAASSLASAHLVGARARWFGTALRALGLASVAYLTAQSLDGPALIGAWSFEALSLSGLAARRRDLETICGAAGFAGLALAHTLLVEAPPTALVAGADGLPAAAIALGAIAVALIGAARQHPHIRFRLLTAAATMLVYLGAVAIITAFQPTGGSTGDIVLDLTVRQQGQVALSGYLSLLGLGALIVGLRRDSRTIRNAALALLLGTVSKVFLYDLSMLTSLYRVVSLVGVGLLLLAGAFAYQRMRPPALPDLRKVHPSQR